MIYAQQVGATSVGRRVSVRWAAPDGVTDVVGELLAHDGSVLTIRRRDGREAQVPVVKLIGSRVLAKPPFREPR